MDFNVSVHDDSCHLRKFAGARAHESAAAAELAYPALHHPTDRLCRANCHPDVPANAALLQGVNTSICEQTFRVTNRYKFMVQHMYRWTSIVLLHELAEARNDSSKGTHA